MEKKAKKNIIGNIGCLTIFVTFTIIMWNSYREADYVEKHGVWTILTITKMEGAPRGFLFSYKFQYNYRAYNYTIVSSNKKMVVGRHFFMMVVPNEESRHLIFDAVPNWFTLEAPPEGWKTCPTEKQMRCMMEQDSIRRGLKEEVKIE
ncbi:hypothetical protein [Bacteroides heparinolyticus]|uniref:hypothetical protein n=1 Tax=Prevotella heparinolytica TaxID=28113 RepID=UPI00359FFA99